MDILEWVWVNGSFWTKEEARIPVSNAGLNSGLVVYEDFKSYGGKFLRVESYVDKLYSDAESLKLKPSVVKSKLIKEMNRVVDENEVNDCMLRVVVYLESGLGYLDRGNKTSVAIIPYTVKESEKVSLDVASESMELNENVLVSNSKIALGSLEKNDVAFFDKEEKLVRSSKGFVVVVKGGLLFIPKFDKLDPKLEAVLGLANDLGYVSKSGELKKEHLQIADGLFLVGPRDDIVTIESFNGYAYTKELELVDEIKKSFDNIVSGKDSSYAHWFD